MAHTAQSTPPARFALRAGSNPKAPSGAWWPRTRSLDHQLADLIDHWPAAEGRVSRILYSPPDWDDHPHSVQVTGRRMKTGSFPHDDTHEVTLVLHNGERRRITVIPPQTPRREAAALLDGITDKVSDEGGWENEGGHP